MSTFVCPFKVGDKVVLARHGVGGKELGRGGTDTDRTAHIKIGTLFTVSLRYGDNNGETSKEDVGRWIKTAPVLNGSFWLPIEHFEHITPEMQAKLDELDSLPEWKRELVI